MGIIQTVKELRPRDKADHYPTPIELCRASINILPDIDPRLVLDPGAGAGVWGQAVKERWSKPDVVGVEMDSKHIWNDYYHYWYVQNYLETEFKLESFDLIVGNPPYGVNADGKKDRKLAEKFVRKSWEYLKPDGYMVFLLRMGFRAGQKRAKNFWPNYVLKDFYVLGRRPSFTGNQRTDATEYSIYVWQKGYNGPTYMKDLFWDYDDPAKNQPAED